MSETKFGLGNVCSRVKTKFSVLYLRKVSWNCLRKWTKIRKWYLLPKAKSKKAKHQTIGSYAWRKPNPARVTFKIRKFRNMTGGLTGNYLWFSQKWNFHEIVHFWRKFRLQPYYANDNFQEPSSRQMRLWQKRLGLEEDDLREEL